MTNCSTNRQNSNDRCQTRPMCNKGITQFYLPATHGPYFSLYSPIARQLIGKLYCLVTEAHRCK